MYKKMLIPLDGSELAEVVFPYAKELAGRLDLEVILLYVGSPARHGFAPMQQAYIERAADTVRRQSQEVQKKSGIKPGGKAVEVHGETAEGYPADEILRYTDENKIDLILMATRGLSGIKRWVLGNVAEKVLRASKIPTLIISAGIPDSTPYDKWPSRTILVPLDGSEMAESVLPHAEALAEQRGTETMDVVLLRVCEPPPMPTYDAPELSGVPLSWGKYMEEEVVKCKQVSAEYLAGIEKRFKNSKIKARSEVLVGKAGDVIVNYASKNPFSIVVMATHGRSGLSRLIYGSVAANLIYGVSNPIFVIKPQ